MLQNLISQTQDNNNTLAYWLSNASTLLLLLQRTLKASGAAGMAPQRRRSSSATLFGRMTQVYIYIWFKIHQHNVAKASCFIVILILRMFPSIRASAGHPKV